jgi:tRNA(Ile)-lysidine synthase TilS/MesJ
MEPCASYFGGLFHLIRPLIYITKEELDKFARSNDFPDPPPECPNSDSTKRKVISEILLLADQSYQNMRKNIFRAAMNYMEMEKKLEELGNL